MRVVLSGGTQPFVLPPTPELDAVRNLAQRFPEAHLREAPVVRAPDLDPRADPSGRIRVWLALEALQVTGSFKVRGALVALAAHKARHGTARPVIAASAGNHGAGIAYAAKALGLEATVVMPRSAPNAKQARTREAGARLVLAPSDHYDDAEALARELARSSGAAFVSGYDDIDVLLGNGASLGFEIVRSLGGVPEIVLVPLGGGGLASGLAYALCDESTDEKARATRHVWGVQSEASPAMALSLERGEAVERLVSDVPTLAEGLEGGISATAFWRAKEAVAGVIVVSEDQIASAMMYGLRELGLVLEGSAATALAPMLTHLPEQVRASATGTGIDLVIVLTGRNVDPERLHNLTVKDGAGFD
jgi:threonine dehydratase